MIELDFTKMDGLITAVTVDAVSGEVLMVAFMNDEAFSKTVETGVVHYYSRSRQKLWKKGESSGNVQTVREIRVDCDRDAIIVKVEQTGPACHEGYKTCFFQRLASDGELEVTEERLMTPLEMYGVPSKA
jgi:phosphoribosyl-AMP cyclohydrolase